MTTSRYSLGTAMVPSSALFMLPMSAIVSAHRPFCLARGAQGPPASGLVFRRLRRGQAIASYCLALAGRREEAHAYFAAIRKTLPRYGVDDFLTAMHFSSEDAALYRKAAKQAGLK